jgi:hypothetical protein
MLYASDSLALLATSTLAKHIYGNSVIIDEGVVLRVAVLTRALTTEP